MTPGQHPGSTNPKAVVQKTANELAASCFRPGLKPHGFHTTERKKMNLIGQECQNLRLKILITIAPLIASYHITPVVAQIIPTPASSERTVVTPALIRGLTSDRIDGGAIRGANLFHSFVEFNIDSGRGVYFTNPAGIENILTRVTGSHPSNILGTLGVLGNANLFLLNPNGIVFGPNASLDLRGSFLGASATSMNFADGTIFSATEATPVLTVSVPIGLGFGTTSGSIVNRSRAVAPGIAQPVGLTVQPGKTLALVGGELTLSGGYLTAPGGRIELGSVKSQSQVRLATIPNGLALGYAGVEKFGDIQLSAAAEVNTSGDKSGDIFVQARSLRLGENSRIISINRGSQPGGGINVNASDSVEITGTGNFIQTVGAIVNGTFNLSDLSNGLFILSSGSGAAGDLVINTSLFAAYNGAFVVTSTTGEGRGGNLSLNASKSVEISASSLFSGTGLNSSGDAGSLTLNTRVFRAQDNSVISSTSLGTGKGGKLTANASESIELTSTNNNNFGPNSLAPYTRLSTSGLGAGDAGDLQVTTGQLTLRNGATIEADALGPGHGGNLTIVADNVILQNRSAINVSSEKNGGNIEIVAGSVILNNKSALAAVSPLGEGGNIKAQASSLQLRQGSIIITTAGFAGGGGNGGDITLNTVTLVDIEKSGIFANAIQGRGGNISIITQGLFHSSDSPITASSKLGVDGVVEIKTIGSDITNSLTPLTGNLVTTEQVVTGSCLARRNREQGKFTVTGTGGLPPNPYDFFRSRYDVTQLQPLQEREKPKERVNSSPSSTAPWKIGDPIVEAQGMVVLANGRILLTTTPLHVAGAPSLVCHSG